jgi:hypothetical protein
MTVDVTITTAEHVPRQIVDQLREAWAAAGGLVELTVYDGQSLGLGHRPGTATDAFVEDLNSFLARDLAVAAI